MRKASGFFMILFFLCFGGCLDSSNSYFLDSAKWDQLNVLKIPDDVIPFFPAYTKEAFLANSLLKYQIVNRTSINEFCNALQPNANHWTLRQTSSMVSIQTMCKLQAANGDSLIVLIDELGQIEIEVNDIRYITNLHPGNPKSSKLLNILEKNQP